VFVRERRCGRAHAAAEVAQKMFDARVTSPTIAGSPPCRGCTSPHFRRVSPAVIACIACALATFVRDGVVQQAASPQPEFELFGEFYEKRRIPDERRADDHRLQ
jgi:hypothetical protein